MDQNGSQNLPFGGHFGVLGVPLAQTGRLAANSPPLGAPWGVSGGPWGAPGLSRGALGGSLGALGGPLGAVGGTRGSLWEPPGGPLGWSGVQNEGHEAPLKSLKKQWFYSVFAM